MSGGYYRADILARDNLQVDQAEQMSVRPGEHLLAYPGQRHPRFSDVLRALDLADDAAARERAVAAEAALSAKVVTVYEQSVHPITPEEAAAEPINRLFFERLIDPP